jgi:hypothetical protein
MGVEVHVARDVAALAAVSGADRSNRPLMKVNLESWL